MSLIELILRISSYQLLQNSRRARDAYLFSWSNKNLLAKKWFEVMLKSVLWILKWHHLHFDSVEVFYFRRSRDQPHFTILISTQNTGQTNRNTARTSSKEIGTWQEPMNNIPRTQSSSTRLYAGSKLNSCQPLTMRGPKRTITHFTHYTDSAETSTVRADITVWVNDQIIANPQAENLILAMQSASKARLVLPLITSVKMNTIVFRQILYETAIY